MGLFDDFGSTFKGLVNQVDSSALPQLLDAALQKSNIGNLQYIVDSFEKNGMADRVNSWVDNKGTSFATADDVLKALGQDKVDRFSRAVGLTTQSTLALLADKLPETVRVASHGGQVMIHRIMA